MKEKQTSPKLMYHYFLVLHSVRSIIRASALMFPVLTSHLESISCVLTQTSLMNTGCSNESLCFQEIIKEINGSYVYTTKLVSVDKMYLRQLQRTDVWMKWNSNKTDVFMPLKQRIYKGQQDPSSVQRGQKGEMSLYLKTPKRLHTVYTNKIGLKN